MTGLENSLQAIAAQFEERIDGLTATITERQRDGIPQHGRALDAPEIWEAVCGITKRSRLEQASYLKHRRKIPTVCPTPDVEAARMAAQIGVAEMSVMKAYRIGHDESWHAWLEAIELSEIEEAMRSACREAVSRFVIEYDQAVAVLVTEEFGRERQVAVSRDRDRVKLVHELLEGLRDDADGLDYDLDLVHLGVICWGRAEYRTLDDLSKYLGQRTLTLNIDDGRTMAWFGGRVALAAAKHKELADFKPRKGTRLAIGNPAPGVEGFRHTRRQAGRAHRVALSRPADVTLYDDVRIEAFALRDETVAREFVAEELDHLGGDDETARKLRSTLVAYFAASHNVRATACFLHIHEHTVTRRLRAIEAHIGQPVNRRRVELELALRIHSLLDSTADPPG